MRAMVREPLLHFLLGGLALFLLFNIVSDSIRTTDDEIVVSAGQIEHMVTIFRKTRQRDPGAEELRGLIDNFITEEMLYREAKAIGLDQDDTIIRRRLRQKMEFLLDDFTIVEPSDEHLQLFLDHNPDRFRADALISFEQVYLNEFSRDKAEDLLLTLQSGAIANPDEFSESHLLPYRFDDAPEAVIGAQFGERFKTMLFDLAVGRWIGPVESPFGLHLVRIDNIVAGYVPPLSDIRKEVERDWLADFRRTAQQEILARMRAGYTVTVEMPEDLKE
jgi:parvulin-like peptidyl-prolyl cis-trans isomerase-like protein